MSMFRDTGGVLPSGLSLAKNSTGRPECLFPLKRGTWVCPKCGTEFSGSPAAVTDALRQHHCP